MNGRTVHNDAVDDLKNLIKTKKAPRFDDVAADELTLWRVSIPDDDDDDQLVLLDKKVSEKKQLKATTKLFKVFGTVAPEDTIHIIVQRPPPVHAPDAPVPARASTPLPGYLSDGSRPGTSLSDKFFAPGPIANFLDAFVNGGGVLPIISGSIRIHGLPRAWHQGFGKHQ
ncbi:hypothetical protein BGX30_004017 [Mortierella sp. GBA39]|nr:hypothetical protein BGX30_004017 [Mortierella sp. GBA39]